MFCEENTLYILVYSIALHLINFVLKFLLIFKRLSAMLSFVHHAHAEPQLIDNAKCVNNIFFVEPAKGYSESV